MNTTQKATDLLLFVWVHGFKGNEVTFESFPDRVCHLLRETHPTLRVESRVFPAYQTRGDLLAATLAFVDWLTTLVVELEVDHGAGGGAGKARVVLMGHSMGGLLIADAARDIAANTREGDPMWPRIVEIIAFDTPYLGLHPHVFKHGLSTAAGYYDTARNVASTLSFIAPAALGLGVGKFGRSSSPSESASPSAGPSRSHSKAATPPDAAPSSGTSSSSWYSALAGKKTLYGLGAVAAGVAAMGGAYYSREHFLNGWKWGYDHMTFVGNLWDAEALEARLQCVEELRVKHQVGFTNHYTHIPPSNAEPLSRTFVISPPPKHVSTPHWYPQDNTIAKDEVSAHMGMFNAKSNDGFYALGLRVVADVGARIEREGVVRREPCVEGFEGERAGSEEAG